MTLRKLISLLIRAASCLREGENPFATFSEWNEEADRRAYRDV